MHTMEEAKQHWCPFARTAYTGETGIQQAPSNRYGIKDSVNLNPEDCRCVASRCMAWQWSFRDEIYIPKETEVPEPFHAFAETKFGEFEYMVCRLNYSDKDGQPLPARGFCGLARVDK